MSGLKLKFSKDGKVTFKKGNSTLPHRTDYIRKKLDDKDFKDLDKIFFEKAVPHHNNESTLEQSYLEGELMTEYIKLLNSGEPK